MQLYALQLAAEALEVCCILMLCLKYEVRKKTV